MDIVSCRFQYFVGRVSPGPMFCETRRCGMIGVNQNVNQNVIMQEII
ncbi:hypothetical protein ACN4EG_02815 [Alkalinema pantanalense CENA528]